MGRSDRRYVFATHTCYHRKGADHPDFCWPSGQRNEITRAAANRFLRRARVNGNVKLERWSY